MKKRLCNYLYILLAFLGLTLAACDHNNGGEGSNDDPNTEEPTNQASIIGNWLLDKATQYNSVNEVDMTNFYGEHFHLIFKEDGILVVDDEINTSSMHWTLDGDQLAFIQAPGVDPVMYTVKQLDETNLVIESGTGTEYVTVMELHRVSE